MSARAQRGLFGARALALAEALAFCVMPAVAHAADGPAAVPAGARARVDVVIIAPREHAADIERVVRALLAPQDVDVRVKSVERLDRGTLDRASDDPRAVARAVIDLTSRETAQVHVVATAPGGPAIHRTFAEGASSDVTHEEIGHAVSSAVEAIVATPPAPAPVPAPAAPAPAPPAAVVAAEATPAREAEATTGAPPFGIDVAILGGARAFGSGAITPAFGGGAGVAFGRGGGGFSLWLLGAYNVPFDVGTSAVSVHATATSVRLVPTLGLFASGRLLVDLGVGAGIDVLHAAPREGRVPVARLAPAQTDFAFPITASVGAHFRLSREVDLVFALGTDIDVAPRRYSAREASGATTSVFDGWALRPYAQAGLSFALFGPPRGGGAR